jgi:hypothetical protein
MARTCVRACVRVGAAAGAAAAAADEGDAGGQGGDRARRGVRAEASTSRGVDDELIAGRWAGAAAAAEPAPGSWVSARGLPSVRSYWTPLISARYYRSVDTPTRLLGHPLSVRPVGRRQSARRLSLSFCEKPGLRRRQLIRHGAVCLLAGSHAALRRRHLVSYARQPLSLGAELHLLQLRLQLSALLPHGPTDHRRG